MLFENHSSNTSIKCKTPEELWSGKPADYSVLRIFGCSAYAHVNEGKLEPRAKKCIFLGYASGVKGYRLWCPNSKGPRFLISRDVTFDESSMLKGRETHSDKESAKEDERVPEKVSFEVQNSNVQPPPVQVDIPQMASDS